MLHAIKLMHLKNIEIQTDLSTKVIHRVSYNIKSTGLSMLNARGLNLPFGNVKLEPE